jgi:riboflavin kinase/FMN adenylyltransferase
MRKVYRDVAGPCLTPDGSVVCIGAFDGVHRGHREVLDRVRARAEELHATPVASHVSRRFRESISARTCRY